MALLHTLSSRGARILLIRALMLGDMLCAIPAVRALRAACPTARITLAGLPWSRSLVERFPNYFAEFLPFPGLPQFPEQAFEPNRLANFLTHVRDERFDLAIQMHGSGSHINPLLTQLGAEHIAGFYEQPADEIDPATFLRYPEQLPEVQRHVRLMEHLGAKSQGDDLEWPVADHDFLELARIDDTRDLHEQRYVCIHPGAQYPSRRWLPERYALVADELANQGFQIVITGTTAELPIVSAVARQMQAQPIVLAGQTSLGALGALLLRARLLISNDTGVAHLAAALRTPSVIVVTGSDVRRWAPFNKCLHRTVMQPANCRPCEHRTCPIDFHCAHRVEARHVLAGAMEVLQATATQSGAPARFDLQTTYQM